MSDTSEFTRNYLLYFIMPFWSLLGFADYLCHRKTDIERTSGLRESGVHLLMLAEIGLPVVLGLYLEITSLVILVMIGTFFIHEATALYDVWYAESRRSVSLLEQHIHSYLAVVPFMVGSFVICLYWDQFLALFGFGRGVADFSLRLKQPPLPWTYHLGMLAAGAVFLGVPYADEFWRCLKARRRGEAGDRAILQASRPVA